jgi:small subunit ribosomal protein S11
MSDEIKQEAPVSEPAAAAPAAPEAPAAPAPRATPASAADAIDAAMGIAPAEPADASAPRRKIKGAKNIPVGVVHILASFNNTTVSVSDPKGNVISWSSAGRCGFKGSRKSTAYAGTVVAQEACKVAVGHGMHEVEILVQGPGSGRESAIRAVQAAGLSITGIRDLTPVPHNGCRARKRRRV